MKNKNLLFFASAVTSGCVTGLQAAPHQKPNIVLICADDLGWSDIGCYGSEVNTPNLDALAQNGVRFTSFHNTSKSFPSRSCLLTGLYAQQTGYDKGWSNPLQNCITLGELLRQAGYITLWSGKHHGKENPITRGFDHYYGLKDGACNYFNPGCQRDGEGFPAYKKYNGEWCIEDKLYAPFTPMEKDFYTTDYFTKYALQWLDKYSDDEKPVFLYLAYNAPHDPLMAWQEDIAKYEGKYREGYEAIRKARYEKQLKMGLIDSRYQLSPPVYPPWESLTPEQQVVEERKMAVYAAMIDRMDQNIGKIMDKMRTQGKFDNTLFIFVSDNGASAEVVRGIGYGEIGTLTNWTSLGGDWANVCNTPLRYYKNYSYEGGIATPLVISWQQGLKNPNRISDFTGHFIDIMATFADLTGAEYPAEYNGKPVLPCEGVSLMPIVRNEKAERTKPIFWEWQNGQAVKDGKWKLVRQGLKNKWSLFDMSADPSEVNDLAEQNARQVELMDKMFNEWKQHVSNEWEQLFNGKDLSGWHIECQPQDKTKTFWTVEDGAILCNSIGVKEHHYVWLVSDREFSDFELQLKFQAYSGSPGNSGLQFRSRYDSSIENGGWMNGPQVDIHPPKNKQSWRTGLIYDETNEVRHWIYPKLPDWKMEDKYKPETFIFKYAEDDGDWNELTLICKGMHIKIMVNGIVRTDWDATGILDDEIHKKYRVGQSGHFAFQLHNGDQLKIRFKDIRIRKISK